MKTFKKISITIMTLMFFMVLSGIGTATLQAQEGRFRNPDWAPAYYPGVRYYYIPDIETFYDLSNQDFVYLDDGQWLFSYELRKSANVETKTGNSRPAQRSSY